LNSSEFGINPVENRREKAQKTQKTAPGLRPGVFSRRFFPYETCEEIRT
jgi:hypothetical protein